MIKNQKPNGMFLDKPPECKLGENYLFCGNSMLGFRKPCFTDFKWAFSEHKMSVVCFKHMGWPTI